MPGCDLSCEISYKGFTRGTWNYFEASHSKGAKEGVDGTLKRKADRLVSQVVDIPTPLSEGQSMLKLFYIQEQDVKDVVKEMPVPVLSNLRFYMVVTLSPGKILYYVFSCMCSATGNLECDCQKTKRFSFNSTQKTPCTAHRRLWGNGMSCCSTAPFT